MANTPRESVAIVGGGITGLFCAYILAQNDRSVNLFEASPRLGGRIRTIRLKPDNTPAGKNWDPNTLEFCAEFGPMRLELDKQLLVKALLDHLNIKPKKLGDAEPKRSRKKGGKGSRAPRGADAAYLIDFPPYTSPTMSSDPKYQF